MACKTIVGQMNCATTKNPEQASNFPYEENGTLYKVSLGGFIQSLGVTGELNATGATNAVPVLTSPIANSYLIAGIEAGAGINAQTSPQGGVLISTVKADEEKKFGFIDENDTSTATTPVNLPANVWVDIPNNGQGAFSNDTYRPESVTEIIDTNTGYLDFSQLTLGSEILVRNDFTVTPSTNNCLLEARYLLGYGASEYPLQFWSERLDNGSGIEYQRVTNFPIYMGDLNTQQNPGKLQIRLSVAGTVKNAGAYVSIRKN